MPTEFFTADGPPAPSRPVYRFALAPSAAVHVYSMSPHAGAWNGLTPSRCLRSCRRADLLVSVAVESDGSFSREQVLCDCFGESLCDGSLGLLPSRSRVSQ